MQIFWKAQNVIFKTKNPFVFRVVSDFGSKILYETDYRNF